MEKLFTKVIKAKHRTYFVDVMSTNNGQNYLAITESKKSLDEVGKFTKSTVMVFKEQAEELFAALNEAVEFVH